MAFAVAFVSLPMSFLVDVARNCNWREFVFLSHSCTVCRSICRTIFLHRVARRVGRVMLGRSSTRSLWVGVTQAFLGLVGSTSAGIVGSVPLALLTLSASEDDTLEIDNVNILVPFRQTRHWYQFLIESLHFKWVQPERVRAEYRDHVRSFAVLAREGMTITLPFSSFLVYAAVSRRCRDGAHAVLAHRVGVVLHRFGIPNDLQAMFWTVVAAARGGLTGSFLVWVSQPDATWWPSDLNFLVGCGGGVLMNACLCKLGFTATRVLSRIPKIVPYPNVPPVFPYTETSFYNSDTVAFHSPHGRRITVTETGDDYPLRLLMESEHSVQAGLWTPTTFIHLYPRDLLRGRSVKRGGSVFRRFADDRPLDLHCLATRGIEVVPVFQPECDSACNRCTCPGIVRRLRGGRGVLVLSWSGERGDEMDVLGDNASAGFTDGRYAFMWSWGTCENYRCVYYGQPADLYSYQDCPLVHEDGTKLQRLLWKCDAVRTTYPVFETVYEGFLFPTSCIRHLIVPIPLDYHASAYITIDDLRWHTWISPRPTGAPSFPMFFPPTMTSGSVLHASITARRLHVRDGYSIVVLLQSAGVDLRRNLLLFPASSADHRSIHGDVLVYLASPKVLGPPQWKRKDTGHTLTCKDHRGTVEIAVLSVIGKVSEAGYYVDGLGNWRDTFREPMEKAKYQLQLERPEGAVFAPDWDTAVAHITKLQDRIRTTEQPRNLVVTSNPTEAYLRFIKHAFEAKTDSSQEGYNTDAWPVQDDYEEQFFVTAQKFLFTPIRARTVKGEPIGGDVIAESLRGALVEVVFSVRHYKLKDPDTGLYDSFSGIVEEILLLDEGVPMKVMKYVTALTVSESISDDPRVGVLPSVVPQMPVTPVRTPRAPLIDPLVTHPMQLDTPMPSAQANSRAARKRGLGKGARSVRSKGLASRSSTPLRRPAVRGPVLFDEAQRDSSHLANEAPGNSITDPGDSVGSFSPRGATPVAWAADSLLSSPPVVRRSTRPRAPRVVPDAADEDVFEDQTASNTRREPNRSSASSSHQGRELSPESEDKSDVTEDEDYNMTQDAVMSELSSTRGRRGGNSDIGERTSDVLNTFTPARTVTIAVFAQPYNDP
ncbi:hypothetical protein C8F01DRAFT_1257732 [Mycena amicta]|nr:hypothetical protein C8F01DRAFT_1257732 [Mycena amicta]